MDGGFWAVILWSLLHDEENELQEEVTGQENKNGQDKQSREVWVVSGCKLWGLLGSQAPCHPPAMQLRGSSCGGQGTAAQAHSASVVLPSCIDL